MNPQDPFQIVRYWTDNNLVVSGKHCQLMNNCTSKKQFQFDVRSASDAFEKCYPFLRFGMVA